MSNINVIKEHVKRFDKSKLKPTITIVKTRYDVLLEQKKGHRKIGPYKYIDNEWKKVEEEIELENITEKETLTFITYNTWFDQSHFDERAMALFEIMKLREPDFISLQEVTPRLVEKIKNQKWIQETYYISDATSKTVKPYGVFQLTKHPVKYWIEHDLPTNMGRKLLVSEILINNQITRVGTVHLESMNNPQYRKAQLARIFPILSKKCFNSFLMGDFNFCSESFENRSNIHSDYCDLWNVVHQIPSSVQHAKEVLKQVQQQKLQNRQENNQNTDKDSLDNINDEDYKEEENSIDNKDLSNDIGSPSYNLSSCYESISDEEEDDEEENFDEYSDDYILTLFKQLNPGFTRNDKRLDRILCRSLSLFKPSHIELLGTEPISEHLPLVRPSDHYGLYGVFKIDNNAPNPEDNNNNDNDNDSDSDNDNNNITEENSNS